MSEGATNIYEDSKYEYFVCYILLRKAGWESASSVHLKVLWNIIYIIQFLVHPVGGSVNENKKTISRKALACLLLGCTAL